MINFSFSLKNKCISSKFFFINKLKYQEHKDGGYIKEFRKGRFHIVVKDTEERKYQIHYDYFLFNNNKKHIVVNNEILPKEVKKIIGIIKKIKSLDEKQLEKKERKEKRLLERIRTAPERRKKYLEWRQEIEKKREEKKRKHNERYPTLSKNEYEKSLKLLKINK